MCWEGEGHGRHRAGEVAAGVPCRNPRRHLYQLWATLHAAWSRWPCRASPDEAAALRAQQRGAAHTLVCGRSVIGGGITAVAAGGAAGAGGAPPVALAAVVVAAAQQTGHEHSKSAPNE